MRSEKPIKLKAAFMLTVFAFNTLVSFACTVGLGMGFNQEHHAGKLRHQSNIHKHLNDTGHEHSNGAVSDHHKKSPEKKDDCCNEKSVELLKVDKSINNSLHPVVKLPVFLAFLSAFKSFAISTQRVFIPHKSLISRFYPPPDKRIVIQSFQI